MTDNHRQCAGITIGSDELDDFGSRLRETPSSEQVTVSRWENIPGMELWEVTNSMRLWRVFHMTYAFCCTDNEAAPCVDWRYRARTHCMSGNQVRLLEPGESHATLTQVLPTDFHVLFFSPEFFGSKLPHFTVGQTNDANVAKVMRGVWRRLEDPYCDWLERTEEIARFTGQLVNSWGEEPPRIVSICPIRIARAKQLVEDRWRDDITLLDVSEAVDLTASHLTRTFREVYGMPLAKYRRLIRAGHALEGLRVGHPISRVAQDCGYIDQSQLTREIKSFFGITPGRYRNASRRVPGRD